MFTSVAFLSILPETLILILGVILLIVEPFLKEERRRNLGWLTACGLLVILVISILVGRPGDPTMTFGNMIRFDWLGFFFGMLFIFCAGITALFLMDHEKVGQRGEVYVLLLASTIGMSLDGIRLRPHYAVSCHRNDIHSALRFGRLYAFG